MFLRQSYKQKPQAWGPVSEVQASIKKNAERVGIDPGNIYRYFPFWTPGKQLDYVNLVSTTGSAVFKKNGLENINLVCPNDFVFSNETGWAIFSQTYIASGDASGSTSPDFLYSYTGGHGITIEIKGWGNVLRILDYHSYAGRIMESTISFEDNDRTWCYHNKGTSLANLWVNGRIDTTNTSSRGNGGSYRDITLGASVWRSKYLLILKQAKDSQIAYFSDNPYFLLHRVPPTFYSMPTGSVLPTPVNLAGVPGLNSITWTWESGA